MDAAAALPLLAAQDVAIGSEPVYEYVVLVTSLAENLLTLAHLYRQRADVENAYDELKNQWGWGSFTTGDLLRCQLAARMVALVYNWWNLFVRYAQPERAREAITSRPLLPSLPIANGTWATPLLGQPEPFPASTWVTPPFELRRLCSESQRF